MTGDEQNTTSSVTEHGPETIDHMMAERGRLGRRITVAVTLALLVIAAGVMAFRTAASSAPNDPPALVKSGPAAAAPAR